MKIPYFKILACGLTLFILLGPLVALLASGVVPMMAYLMGAVPALVFGFLLCLLRIALAGPVARWQRQWPAWLLAVAAFAPGAVSGSAVTLLYARVAEPLLYNDWMTLYLGAMAGGVCNALFWRMRFNAPAQPHQE
ncbi:hypothetical protein [Chromobacterium violaceum]|uniref:Transmembrane protein n=2 Tax=Chromobacterium violaceum TaxID=536 RepID=A0A1R0ML34_CHRVL|nr:hypothetical protein [Chromobacterium violaceum]AAQ58568.1 hypothetical protein CV_0894 [Chromobacterium violaceum ATCC 12472]ATP27653.1 hypothetical protein CRN81_04125 [Chromobacterium violaceum]ATP31566.1 hypothetical protein CR207_04140 [Chromobacterium violaceum]KMN50581.1 hypothetical protein VK93_04025 [Chromobacterium violaceum]KMN85780.1 hypothetical protein VL02_12760 [Chromobacterium violaceum]